MTKQRKKIKEPWPWSWIWREDLRAGQSSCGVGLGDAFQFPKEDLESIVWEF